MAALITRPMLVVFTSGRELGAFGGGDGDKVALPTGDGQSLAIAPAAIVLPVSPTMLPVSWRLMDWRSVGQRAAEFAAAGRGAPRRRKACARIAPLPIEW